MFELPPDPGHYDPKGEIAAADQDHRTDTGLGEDILHLVRALLRIVTWPFRMIVQRLGR